MNLLRHFSITGEASLPNFYSYFPRIAVRRSALDLLETIDVLPGPYALISGL